MEMLRCCSWKWNSVISYTGISYYCWSSCVRCLPVLEANMFDHSRNRKIKEYCLEIQCWSWEGGWNSTSQVELVLRNTHQCRVLRHWETSTVMQNLSLFCLGGTVPEVKVPVTKIESWASCGSSGAPGLQASTSLLLAATSVPCVVQSPTWCSTGSWHCWVPFIQFLVMSLLWMEGNS